MVQFGGYVGGRLSQHSFQQSRWLHGRRKSLAYDSYTAVPFSWLNRASDLIEQGYFSGMVLVAVWKKSFAGAGGFRILIKRLDLSYTLEILMGIISPSHLSP